MSWFSLEISGGKVSFRLYTIRVISAAAAALWLLPLKTPGGNHGNHSGESPASNIQNRADGSFLQRTWLQEDEMIKKVSGGYKVLSEKGKNLGGPYKTKEQAEKRLRQVEYFKHRK